MGSVVAQIFENFPAQREVSEPAAWAVAPTQELIRHTNTAGLTPVPLNQSAF